MAIGDAYATAAEYRARVTKTDTGDDTTIDAQLKAVSHYIDARCRRKDGFNLAASAVARTYDIESRPGPSAAFTRDYLRLWLPEDIGATDSLAVKVDLNGDYDVADSGETLAINTDFWLGPSTAGATPGTDPRPYEFIDIHPQSTLISAWPIQRRAIEITAKWGWPEVPEAVKEATVLITRQLRDAQESGYLLTLENLDAALPQGREIATLVRGIENAYKRAALT